MSRADAPLAQRSRVKLHFEHRDMDYYYAWLLGRRYAGGADAGECAALVERIDDGNVASWQREWQALGESLAVRAEEAAARGDSVAACGLHLRAASAFRAPLFMMAPDDECFRPLHARMVGHFRDAAAFSQPPLLAVEVPFSGQHLAGYFHSTGEPGRRPTLVVVGGIETFAEDCWFMVGCTGAERGWNVLAVDLPGQGMNPDQGLYFEARTAPALAAVLDYALARADVDPEHLAVFGFSWGGHMVFKAAEADPRICALVANPAMPDVFRAARAQQNHRTLGDPVGRLVFEQIAWRFGLALNLRPANVARRFAKMWDYLAHGRARVGRITCPVLCLAGDGEAPITLEVARSTLAALPHPQSKLIVFSRADGSEAHCQVDNPALPNAAMFDWLDDLRS